MHKQNSKIVIRYAQRNERKKVRRMIFKGDGVLYGNERNGYRLGIQSISNQKVLLLRSKLFSSIQDVEKFMQQRGPTCPPKAKVGNRVTMPK